MDTHKKEDAVAREQLDVYEQARIGLTALIDELCEAMDSKETASYKRKGYEMIAAYYRQPVHTGELMMTLSVVLEDLLHKLDMTQESENVSVVLDEYSMLKRDE